MEEHPIKTGFKESIKFMFPQGLNWITDKYQWRDSIRIFTMGWIDSMKSFCDGYLARGEKVPKEFVDSVQNWIDFCSEIQSPDWMPDMSWSW